MISTCRVENSGSVSSNGGNGGSPPWIVEIYKIIDEDGNQVKSDDGKYLWQYENTILTTDTEDFSNDTLKNIDPYVMFKGDLVLRSTINYPNSYKDYVTNSGIDRKVEKDDTLGCSDHRALKTIMVGGKEIHFDEGILKQGNVFARNAGRGYPDRTGREDSYPDSFVETVLDVGTEKKLTRFNKKVKAKMLELENSYSAPSARKETVKESKVRSEDDVILKNFNEIKLKSFSKPMSLKETQRTLINKDSNNSRNKSFKEGKFVKLKTAGQYNKEQKQLGTSDLINMGDKYLMKKNTRMNKEKENYLVSSLDEYMSILDTEKPDLTEMSAIKMPTSEAMIRSGVSNPISSSYARVPQNIIKPEQRVDGLIVKSGYNIDANSGFYVVSLDGVSAIVGKIKENIFVLKKFDRVIDSPIQVRRDDGNVYIVKAGKYKCLVNVEHDKMGTLIEI